LRQHVGDLRLHNSENQTGRNIRLSCLWHISAMNEDDVMAVRKRKIFGVVAAVSKKGLDL
jgi:hypothetical protein